MEEEEAGAAAAADVVSDDEFSGEGDALAELTSTTLVPAAL